MNKVSAVVTCFNSTKTIEKCLKSLSWADEIVVIDSFSEDDTVELVQKIPGIKLHQQSFKGFFQQKQQKNQQTQLSQDVVMLKSLLICRDVRHH